MYPPTLARRPPSGPDRPRPTWLRMVLYTAPVAAIAGHSLPRLAAAGVAVAAGMYLRALRRRAAAPAGAPAGAP